MGRERTRTRKQVYLYLAGLILFGLAGCAFLKTLQERDEARESLLRGRRLFAQGDYEGSLKENQTALSLSANQAPADEALFQMALIYAHADNPKKDQQQAVALFRRVIHEHSRTPLAEQAKVWVGLLQMIERLSQTNEKLSQTNEKLSQTNEKLSQTNEKLSQMMEKSKQMMEKSKQVDIEIEEKKRGKER